MLSPSTLTVHVPFACLCLWLSGFCINHNAEEVFTPPVTAIPTGTEEVNVCNCTITQSGNTYPISALQGTIPAASFYSYSFPNNSSANTGLELPDALIIFTYEDINTGIISLFLIADIANSGTGGSMQFEANCLPPGAYVSVQDDAGEFQGAPPLITGNWVWSGCCTDGGVIENIGCSNTINLDLLVSSGLDSIVWLTGDIANPTQILLDMSGEAITINCGGGVCCPVGFDTAINSSDATCEDTDDGMIAVVPQDGTPPYTYNWSNGGNTATINGLAPGTYTVTITDAQGCMEELLVPIDVSPGKPSAAPASLVICSTQPEDYFDLTSVENTVNGGNGLDVIWFENPDLSGTIAMPDHYLSGSSVVYAATTNGPCLSDPVAVPLTLITSPMAFTSSMHVCEEMNDMAYFDLTVMDNTVSGGVGVVIWYTDPGQNNPIADPTYFFSGSTTVFATVYDDPCFSEPIEIELTVDPKPDGDATEAHACGDENGEAIFDLTQLDNTVGGGLNGVSWFLEIELLDPINSPNAFQSATTTVYAVVFDGICFSDAVPVSLVVEATPTGVADTLSLCANSAGEATFALHDYDSQVSNGTGAVDWFLDQDLNEPIPNPDAFTTETVLVYITVDNGLCVSDPVPVYLEVLEGAFGNPSTLETCADSTGNGVFDLLAADTLVSGGTGNVTWYHDPQGQTTILNPVQFISSGGIVYAQIQDSSCLSGFIPVTLAIIHSVTAMPADLQACDQGNGTAIFNLPSFSNAVSNGTGVVNWFSDPAGMNGIVNPSVFVSGDSVIYARVIAGTCVSDMVPINLDVVQSPVSNNIDIAICGDTIGMTTIDLHMLDLMINGGAGMVNWYSDATAQTVISNPGNFQTADTLLFATVVIGNCVSSVAMINLHVGATLTANSISLDFCKPAGDTLWINLNDYNGMVGTGPVMVQWFEDSMAMVPVADPLAYPGIETDTVFAVLTDGVCTSDPGMIVLTLVDEPEAHPFTINRCGDVNGQITIDLSAVEGFVSNNTGVVSWYADQGQSIPIGIPGAFTAGDTVIYATVTNGNCFSSVVPVTLDVTDSLTIHPHLIQYCLVAEDTAYVDLTLSDFAISGGNGNVIWYTDMNAIDTLFTTTAFVTIGDTLFAQVEADGCLSAVEAIPVLVASAYYADPVCVFTSIDSVAISWTDVTDEYEISWTVNGIPAGPVQSVSGISFGIGGLGEGNTVTMTIAALFDSICTAPLVNTISCVTDVCPLQVLSVPGLNLFYCRDEPFIPLFPDPPGSVLTGEGVSGDTLYPDLVSGNSTLLLLSWTDSVTGCVYDTTFDITIFNPIVPPVATCSATYTSVSFDFAGVTNGAFYTFTINQDAEMGPYPLVSDPLSFTGLHDGDRVTIRYWVSDALPCGNSDTITLTCSALTCPPATVRIVQTGFVCDGDDAFQLQYTSLNLPAGPVATWSGEGITDPSGLFDPKVAGIGTHLIHLEILASGCVYADDQSFTVSKNPLASFTADGRVCMDSTTEISFDGSAFLSSDWYWDFDGAEVDTLNPKRRFLAKWDQPGTYYPSLFIDFHGCVSELFMDTIVVDAALGTLDVQCVQEDYYALTISWEPVANATVYSVFSTLGNGTLNGTTYTLRNLPDDTEVTIYVTADHHGACGPKYDTITCRTLDYIPVETFIPNVFSPNDDGINDVFYVQANSTVEEIKLLRIYDRWGNEVFGATNIPPNDPKYGWNGRFHDHSVNPDVFVYYLVYTTVYGEEIKDTGDITVLK